MTLCVCTKCLHLENDLIPVHGRCLIMTLFLICGDVALYIGIMIMLLQAVADHVQFKTMSRILYAQLVRLRPAAVTPEMF